jgi:hypothetical protein
MVSDGAGPDAEAERPVALTPSAVAALCGLLLGGLYGFGAVEVVAKSGLVPRDGWLSFVAPCAAFGALLGGALQAFEDALAPVPAPAIVFLATLAGACAGGLAAIASPPDAAWIVATGAAEGLLLAVLHRVCWFLLP